MLLAVDCGNTDIVFGLMGFRKLSEVLKMRRLPSAGTYSTEDLRRFVTAFVQDSGGALPDIKAVILGSVVPRHDPSFRSLAAELGLRFLSLSERNLRLGFENLSTNPEKTGADFLANTAGAFGRLQRDCFVADFGTATKLHYVDSGGAFCGYMIFPGLHVLSRALSQSTALLPSIDFIKPASVLGKNTIGAMQSGLFWGTYGAVKTFIEKARKETGTNAPVLGTGGIGILFEKEGLFNRYIPTLTLEGLGQIYEKNL